MNKTTIVVTAGIFSLIAGGTVLAKTSLGTVKTPSGTEVAKVGVEGTVTTVSETGKNQITVKESDGKEYTVKMGPRWFADTAVKVGDSVKVEGIEHQEGQIGAWKITKSDGSVVTLRTEAGKPAWAGKGRGGKGQGMHRGNGERPNFADENKDGFCDHQQ